MTDFYSLNRCVCSTRSHGPLLCAFCLSFHFKMSMGQILPESVAVCLRLSSSSPATGTLMPWSHQQGCWGKLSKPASSSDSYVTVSAQRSVKTSRTAC